MILFTCYHNVSGLSTIQNDTDAICKSNDTYLKMYKLVKWLFFALLLYFSMENDQNWSVK